jgi:hypothetical protein
MALSSGQASASRIKSSSSFLPFAEAALRIAPSPELSLRDILKASDSHRDTENLSFYRAGRKFLVSGIGCELNPKVAAKTTRIQGMLVVFDYEDL